MAVFHFAFDLNHFGCSSRAQNFYRDPFWTSSARHRQPVPVLRRPGPGVALQAGQGWPRFWRRWAQVAGCALLVSIGSALMFPRSWISFGVLHGMALMLVVARLLAPLRAGCGRWARWRCAAAGGRASGSSTALDELGGPGHAQAHHRGLRAAAALAGRDAVGPGGRPVAAAAPARLLAGAAAARRCSRWRCWAAGALSFYMLHQPVFIGIRRCLARPMRS
jgi:hypothetical protein